MEDVRKFQGEYFTSTVLKDPGCIYTIECDICNFSDILRRAWAIFRLEQRDASCEKYKQYTKPRPELDHKIYNNFLPIFEKFIYHDSDDNPLFLVFCLQNGDEIVIQRFVDSGTSPDKRPEENLEEKPKGRYFYIVECLFSQMEDHVCRNVLPIEDGVMKVVAFIQKFT